MKSRDMKGGIYFIVFCMFLCAPNAWAKKDNAIYTVKYSYEKQTRTGEKRYVLMPQTFKVAKEVYADFKTRSRVLFNALKSSKKSNYGATRFATKDEVVFLYLDEKKKSNHSFIMAEAIYTFTENGARHVEFPDSPYQGRPHSRKDVTFSAYQLTVPYWEGFPPTQLNGGLLSFSDGTLVTQAALVERMTADDATLIDQFKKTIDLGDVTATEAIIKALKVHPMRGVERALLPLLKSANTSLRKLGLDGLKGIDLKEVNVSLRAVMDQDPEVSLRDQAAQMLSQSKDAQFSESALIHALRSKDVKIASQAASQLASARSKEVNERLFDALKRNESAIRVAAISALMTRKTQKSLLKKLAGELSVDAKVEIAQALIKDKKSKDEAYSFLVTQPQGLAAAAAATDLAQYPKNKKTLSLLIKALTHPDAEARVAAARSLAKIGGPNALKALSEGDILDSESGSALHQAMRDVYAGLKNSAILKDADHQKKLNLRSAATGSLGALFVRSSKVQSKVMKALKGLKDSKEALIRAGVARSFGEIKTPEAQEALLTLFADEAVEVQRRVVASLKGFPEEVGRAHLIKSLSSTDVKILVNTLESLGSLQSTEALSQLLVDGLLTHERSEVRRSVVGALSEIAPALKADKQAGITPQLSLRLSQDQDLMVRLRAVEGLGRIPSEDSNFSLAENIQTKNETLAIAIVKAFMAHKNQAGAEGLGSAMDHENMKVRATAYEGVKVFEDAKSKSTLKTLLEKRLAREEDSSLKALISAQLKSL